MLVRSRAHLIEIVNALKRHRIAFQAIEIDQLGERQVIEDLMALTFALLHPGGSRVVAGRSARAMVRPRPSTICTLWRQRTIERPSGICSIGRNAALSEDGRARIQRILPVMEQAIAERGRRPLRDWVENTWLQLGGPACVQDETALEDAAAYFDLLEGLAEGADLADFEWFREQVNALFAQPNAQGRPALQLMTIHKAKGLEFDTVILPGLGAVPRAGRAASIALAGASRRAVAGADRGVWRRQRSDLRISGEHRTPQVGSRNSAFVVCRGNARAAQPALAGLGDGKGRWHGWGARIAIVS